MFEFPVSSIADQQENKGAMRKLCNRLRPFLGPPSEMIYGHMGGQASRRVGRRGGMGQHAA